jgi:hypothetical protein
VNSLLYQLSVIKRTLLGSVLDGHGEDFAVIDVLLLEHACGATPPLGAVLVPEHHHDEALLREAAVQVAFTSGDLQQLKDHVHIISFREFKH